MARQMCLALALWFALGIPAHMFIEHVCCDHPNPAVQANPFTIASNDNCCAFSCHVPIGHHDESGTHAHHVDERQLNSSRDIQVAKCVTAVISVFDVGATAMPVPPAADVLPPLHAYLARTLGMRAPPSA